MAALGSAGLSFDVRESPKYKDLRAQAEMFEKNADWEEACKIYEVLLGMDRGQKDVKDRYNHCLQRLNQVRRHRDLSFRKEVLSLETGEALRLYGLILDTILKNSLDPKKVDATRVFRKGLEELRLGLSDPVFLQANLPNAKDADIAAFKKHLAKFATKKIKDQADAIKQVKEVARAAYHMLQFDPTAVILEFTCGACYVVDEYSAYMTPTELREWRYLIDGAFVGVGITLAMSENGLIIADIIPGSPAAEIMALKAKDRIITIDKKDTANLTPEAALDLLEGPNGSMVEIVVESAIGARMAFTLQRKRIVVPSVATQLHNNVGIITINSFQKNTHREIDKALAKLANDKVKALILDLRGNPGGLFKEAIEVANRFLTNGIITSTQNSDPSFNIIYQARNANAVVLPLVVLIDGNTTSAAEILAGALKENNRAQLVGQTTFGKGCTQTVVELPTGRANAPTGGLRITVTRFFTPNGQSYTGNGVVPHFLVDRFMDETDAIDRQLEKALELAQK
jgi:carboxyl-terminal processing protease